MSEKVNRKGKVLLIIVGIIMTAGGAIGILAGAAALLGIITFTSSIDMRSGVAVMIAVAISVIASGTMHLVAGIVGIRKSGSVQAYKQCLPLGIACIALVILSNIINAAAGYDLDIGSLLLGIALPMLYIAAAYLNKKEMS